MSDPEMPTSIDPADSPIPDERLETITGGSDVDYEPTSAPIQTQE